MANEELPSPQIVGNTFVQQYYTAQNQDPTQMYQFYENSSMLSRPNETGDLETVDTMEGIRGLITSFDHQSYHTEICQVDVQSSFNDGMLVLVNGCLTGKDNQRRKFVQTFFLAPQENGYYVLNDILRFLDDKESVIDVDGHVPAAAVSASESEIVEPPPQVQENTEVNNETATMDAVNQEVKEVDNPVDNGNAPLSDNEVVDDFVALPTRNNSLTASEADPPQVQQDASKKSYLSIVQSLTINNAPFTVRGPFPKSAKQLRSNIHSNSAPEKSTTPASNSNPPSEKNIENPDSIFVPNLPMDATENLLREEFSKIGPIKPDGIQVRSFKDSGNCFGFVKFESADTALSAVKANPFNIGGRVVRVELKRGNGSGSRRGGSGFRQENGKGSDIFKGRRGFNDGRKFGRNDRNNIGRNNGNEKKNHDYDGAKFARQSRNQA